MEVDEEDSMEVESSSATPNADFCPSADGYFWANTLKDPSLYLQRLRDSGIDPNDVDDDGFEEVIKGEDVLSAKFFKTYTNYLLKKNLDANPYEWFQAKTVLEYLRNEKDYGKQAFLLKALSVEEMKGLKKQLPDFLYQGLTQNHFWTSAKRNTLRVDLQNSITDRFMALRFPDRIGGKKQPWVLNSQK